MVANGEEKQRWTQTKTEKMLSASLVSISRSVQTDAIDECIALQTKQQQQ